MDTGSGVFDLLLIYKTDQCNDPHHKKCEHSVNSTPVMMRIVYFRCAAGVNKYFYLAFFRILCERSINNAIRFGEGYP